MIALLRSELLKARTTRTAAGLALGLALIVGGIAAIAAATVDHPAFASLANQHATRDAISSAGFVPLFALLFGLLSSTSEYRHGTISPTLLVAPSRERVVLAKAISSALVGLALAASALVVALAVAVPVLAGRGFEIDGGDIGRAVAGVLAAAALWGALGAGIGSIVTNQVGVIVGCLAFALIVEPLLVTFVSKARYLPFHSVASFIGLGGGDDTVTVGAGVAATIGYVVAANVLGAVRTRARDVS